MTTTTNKFIIVYECLEARSFDDSLMTPAGTKVSVQNGEWGPTAFNYPGFLGVRSAMLFDTVESATSFAEKFEGAPWYYKNSGKFEVIEVEPIFEVSGYREVAP